MSRPSSSRSRSRRGEGACSPRCWAPRRSRTRPYYVGWKVAGQDVGLDPNGHAQGVDRPGRLLPRRRHRGQRPGARQAAGGGGPAGAQRSCGAAGIARVKDADGNLIGLLRTPERLEASRALSWTSPRRRGPAIAANGRHPRTAPRRRRPVGRLGERGRRGVPRPALVPLGRLDADDRDAEREPDRAEPAPGRSGSRARSGRPATS